jgi:hypothetical protein
MEKSPESWQKAIVIPVHRKGNKNTVKIAEE